MGANKLELKLIKKEQIAEDTYNFYFQKDGRFKFVPGQYLKLSLTIEGADDRGTSRYFTISSSPTDKELIITTRIIESSFKRKLNDLNAGDVIKAFGPIGYFNIDLNNGKKKVFLSGGMGITPFRSILRYVDNKRIKVSAILIAFFSIEKNSVFLNELKDISDRNSGIEIKPIFTKEDKKYSMIDKSAGFRDLIKNNVHNWNLSEFYIVGPENFEFEIKNVVLRMGIKEDNIFTENFPGY